MKRSTRVLFTLMVCLVGASSGFPDTPTTTFGLARPNDGDRTWGAGLNSAMDIMDAYLPSFREDNQFTSGITKGEVVSYTTTGSLIEADATSASGVQTPVGVAVSVLSTSSLVMTAGLTPAGTFSSLTPGSLYYLSTTAGGITASAPTSPDAVVVVGVASASGTQLLLNPPANYPPTSSLSSVVTKTTTYTATSSDRFILVDTSSNDVTINLPAASSVQGLTYTIKKISAANTMIIDPSGSEDIEGPLTYSKTEDGSSLTIYSDGTATWYIEGGYPWPQPGYNLTALTQDSSGDLSSTGHLALATTKVLTVDKLTSTAGVDLQMYAATGQSTLLMDAGGSSSELNISQDGFAYFDRDIKVLSGSYVGADNYRNAAGSGTPTMDYGLTLAAATVLTADKITSNASTDLQVYAPVAKSVFIEVAGGGAAQLNVSSDGRLYLARDTWMTTGKLLRVDSILNSTATGPVDFFGGLSVVTGDLLVTAGGLLVNDITDALGTSAPDFTFGITVASGETLSVDAITNSAGSGPVALTYGYTKPLVSKTIDASGMITYEPAAFQSIEIDTYAAASSDNLTEITGTCTEGDVITFKSTNSARDVTFADTTNQLDLAGSVDFLMNGENDWLMLECWQTSGVWGEVSRSDN